MLPLILCFLVFILNALGKKPNIIFLMVDEMDGRNMDISSPDEYNAMEMPNLRNMARNGAQFVRHYTNGPECVCSRSVLWTGRRTHDIKVYNNAFGIAASSNGTLDSNCVSNYNTAKCREISRIQSANYTILDAMELLGYNVYLVGKMHIGAGMMDKAIGSNLSATAFEEPTNIDSFVSITRSANILKKYNETNAAGPIKQINDTDPNPHAGDVTFAQQCVERLNNLGSTTQSEPFMLYCSIVAPHPPMHTNSTWLEGVNINKITIPNWNKTNYNAFDRYTSIFENIWDENYSDQELIKFRKTYYGLNVEADYLLGTVINASYLNGFNLSNTFFVFTSDHGEMNLDHRQMEKFSMYEGSARIPLWIAGPNIESNVIIKNLTETVDIFPTLMSLGQSDDIPNWLAGSSLMPFLNGNVDNTHTHPNYVTSQYHSKCANTGLFMVRKDEYKYITYGHYGADFKNYKPQLFDLSNDPSELNDISDSNQEIVDEMENLLLDRYDYEMVDCVAKKSDMDIFNQFIWNVYNQSYIKHLFAEYYHGFNQSDWENAINWRNELTNSPKCVQQNK